MIDLADLKIESWPPRNSVGGQQVGTNSGVKITHIPTETEAFVNCHRSGHRNRQIAMEMLETALTSPHFQGR